MAGIIGNINADPAAAPRQFIDLKIHTQLPSPHTILLFHNIKANSTISELKDHLRQTLPSNPAPSAIKFIYRGHRVRNDSDTLETILTPEAVQQEATHVLHCVLQDPRASTPTRIPALAARVGPASRPGSTTPHTHPVPGSQVPGPPRFQPVNRMANGTPIPGSGTQYYSPQYQTTFQQPVFPQQPMSSHMPFQPNLAPAVQAMQMPAAQMQGQLPTQQTPFEAAAATHLRQIHENLHGAQSVNIRAMAQDSMNALDASSERLQEAVQLLQGRLEEMQEANPPPAYTTQDSDVSRATREAIETARDMATTTLQPQLSSLREQVQSLRQRMNDSPALSTLSDQTEGIVTDTHEDSATAHVEATVRSQPGAFVVPPQTAAQTRNTAASNGQADIAVSREGAHANDQHATIANGMPSRTFTQQGTGPNGVSWTFTSTTTNHEYPQQPGLRPMLQPHQPGTVPGLDFRSIMPGLSVLGGQPQTTGHQWLSASHSISMLDDLQYQLQRTIEGFWRLSNLNESTQRDSVVRLELSQTRQQIASLVERRNAIQQSVNAILAEGSPPGHSQPTEAQIATLQNLSDRFSNAVSNFTSEWQRRRSDHTSAGTGQVDGATSSQQPVETARAYLLNTPNGPYGFVHSSQGSYGTGIPAYGGTGSAARVSRQPTPSHPDANNTNTGPAPQANPAQPPQHFAAQGNFPYFHPFDHPNAQGQAQQQAQLHNHSLLHNHAQLQAQAQLDAHNHAHQHPLQPHPNHAPAPANPALPGPEDPNAHQHAIAINLTPLLQALWFFIRIYGVMWILLGGIGTTWRTWILVATTIVYWAVQAGVGREYIELARGWWDGVVGAEAGGGAAGGAGRGAVGNEGVAAGVNENGNANAAPGAGAANTTAITSTRPNAAVAAQQRTEPARPRNAIREAIRPVEQTLALLIASLWPGVGERHVAERERVRREEAEREIERRRREEESRNGSAVADAGVANEGQTEGQAEGVSTGLERVREEGEVVHRGRGDGVGTSGAAEARPNP